MNDVEWDRVRRFQVVAVSVVGAVAVICFALSLFLAPAADGLRMVAAVAAGICAVIGVSFAFTGTRR